MMYPEERVQVWESSLYPTSPSPPTTSSDSSLHLRKETLSLPAFEDSATRSICYKKRKEKSQPRDRSCAAPLQSPWAKPLRRNRFPVLNPQEPGAQETLVRPLPLVLTSSAWSSPPASHQTTLSDFSETLAGCAEQEGRKGGRCVCGGGG